MGDRPTGLTESDTMRLLYTNVRWDGEPPLHQIGPIGGDSLRQRYSRAPVQVFHSATFAGADSRAVEAHAAAVAAPNEALRDRAAAHSCGAREARGGRTYDGLIAACASASHAKALLTFNSRHFDPAPRGVAIVAPADLE